MAAGAAKAGVNGVVVLVIIGLITTTAIYHKKAEREALRNRLSGDAFTAWLQDLSDEKKDLSRFLPLAKASIAAEREALGGDRAALAGHLMKYSMMSSLTHYSLWGSGPAEPPGVKDFERELARELGDQLLQMLNENDPRVLTYANMVADSDGEGLIAQDVQERLLLGAVRLARAKGQTPMPKFQERAASRFNSWSWNVALKPGESADAYAHAIILAETAVYAAPDNGNYVNTLAYAQYRAGKYPEAAATIARAVSLRKQPDDLDTVMVAMTAARAGKLDEARPALESLERREAARAKEAISKGRKPSVDPTLQALMAEARALLPPASAK